MGRQFTISDMGLKLIKAYEGYRPVDRMLVSGQRVIGYGHRVLDGDAKFLSKSEAEDVLKADLAPFEDMINENVHAPLTQSQFDALCSFAFNIGPKAFLRSDTLRALNNGRPLDAANGFDIWRKSEIDGKTYVVDVLMRRRTAEKALFLRPAGRTVSAPRVDLPPVSDETIALLSTEDALPIFSKDENAGMVEAVPYDMQLENASKQNRRRTDGPSGILSLSDVYEDETVIEDEASLDPDLRDDKDSEAKTIKPSLIAAEDEKLKDRLDALIEDVKLDQKASDTSDWPDTLITTDDTAEDLERDNVVGFKSGLKESNNIETVDDDDKVDLVIDNLKKDDAIRARSDDSASKYIELNETPEDVGRSNLPYWIMITFGSLLLGASIAAYLRGAEALFGANGQLIVICGIIIGAMMLMGSLYYAFRQTLRK